MVLLAIAIVGAVAFLVSLLLGILFSCDAISLRKACISRFHATMDLYHNPSLFTEDGSVARRRYRICLRICWVAMALIVVPLLMLRYQGRL